MVKAFSEEAYQASFDDMMEIVNLPNPDGKRSVCAHIWEFVTANREYEIDSLMGVLLDEEGAVYDDTDTSPPATRHQRTSGKGLLAISTSALSVNKPCDLFEPRNGIMFRNSQLVHASERDSYSYYIEKDNEKAYLEIDDLLSGGKSQHDPLDARVHAFAKKEFQRLFSKSSNMGGGQYNEVCVNALPENIGGIINNDKQGVFNDSGDSWTERINNNVNIKFRLESLLKDYDQVVSKLESVGYELSPPPTIMIHHFDPKLHKATYVHFPPTEKNRKLVAEALQEQGVAPHGFAHAGKTPDVGQEPNV